MTFYCQLTGRAWFLLPTFAVIEHEDGERMFALIWLNLEMGFRVYP